MTYTGSDELPENSIVINEIMYNPISGEDDDQYIELYNRGNTPVDLAGWSIAKGVNFTFEARTLGAKQYLVVAGAPSAPISPPPCSLSSQDRWCGARPWSWR